MEKEEFIKAVEENIENATKLALNMSATEMYLVSTSKEPISKEGFSRQG